MDRAAKQAPLRLIAGQAPGRKTHESGVPFDDASGDRLRRWMGVGPDVFYGAAIVAIVPMGFCYPGKGRSSDLPPRPECAPKWRQRLLACMPRIELTLVIGKFAQHWHLPDYRTRSLTGTVRAWRDHWPAILPLPHPSPRNNGWFTANRWFDDQLVPELQRAVRAITERRQGIAALARHRKGVALPPPEWQAPERAPDHIA